MERVRGALDCRVVGERAGERVRNEGISRSHNRYWSAAAQSPLAQVPGPDVLRKPCSAIGRTLTKHDRFVAVPRSLKGPVPNEMAKRFLRQTLTNEPCCELFGNVEFKGKAHRAAVRRNIAPTMSFRSHVLLNSLYDVRG